MASSIAVKLFVRLVGTLPFNRRGRANVLGLTIPPGLTLRPDEVIERLAGKVRIGSCVTSNAGPNGDA